MISASMIRVLSCHWSESWVAMSRVAESRMADVLSGWCRERLIQQSEPRTCACERSFQSVKKATSSESGGLRQSDVDRLSLLNKELNELHEINDFMAILNYSNSLLRLALQPFRSYSQEDVREDYRFFIFPWIPWICDLVKRLGFTDRW